MTLPASYYTDPAWFQREMEAIHFDMWLCAGRTEQIANAWRLLCPSRRQCQHHHYPRRAWRSPRIPQCLPASRYALCQHDEGKFNGRIQCQYHAWTYKLDGTLANAPHMEKVQGFREADYPLNAVAQYPSGMATSLSISQRGQSPSLSTLPGSTRSLPPGACRNCRWWSASVYQLKANWKLIIQNYSECLHCPIVHPLLNRTIALHEWRQRTAAANLPWRSHGPACEGRTR